MSTAVTTRKTLLSRSITSDSIAASSASSASVSPDRTPAQSPSTTSLSSLASLSGDEQKSSGHGKLLDTYGNEFQIPDFSIKDIRDAIPAHCFERSGLRGLGYVARDLACLASVFYIFHSYVTPENIPSYPARVGLWSLYTVVQGLFATGIWVLAHECGHQSFSTSKVLNDTVGWTLHSALLVPYFSWKISHGKHHKATGHLERDMVFVPKTRAEYASRVGALVHEVSELMEETPIATAFHLVAQQLGGWPMYLFTNVTGHNCHERQIEGRGKGKQNGFGGRVNHFDPRSPLYEAKDAKLILLSDLGLAIAAGTLYLLGNKFGWSNLLVWYFLPYLWVNHWLGKLTYSLHLN
jgi:omega-6 fatty acid desaturase (delta-12 desaturase)